MEQVHRFRLRCTRSGLLNTSKSIPELRLSYLSVGSSEGVKRFVEGVVDFSGSDAAMTDEEMSQVDDGVQLIPTAAGSVVLALQHHRFWIQSTRCG